jgi:hypothetical protein
MLKQLSGFGEHYLFFAEKVLVVLVHCQLLVAA